MKYLLACVLFLSVLSTPAVSQGPGRGSIAGTVVNALDGRPLAGITITISPYIWRGRDFGGTLVEAIQNQFTLPRTQLRVQGPVKTDSEGRFSVDLDSGTYRIAISEDGYAPYSYGQRISGGQGGLLHITGGENLRGLALSLTPTAVITGTVNKRGGGPVAAAAVSLLRDTWHSNGSHSREIVASAKTDERGEYRLYWVPPGEFMIRVTSSTATRRYGINGRPAPFANEAFDGEGSSGPIQVSAGEERQTAAIFLDPAVAKTYTIRGRVVDSRTAQPPRRAGVQLLSREAESQNSFYPASYDAVNGTFMLANIPPGKYLLKVAAADYWGGISTGPDVSVPDLPGLAQAAIDVVDSDITNQLMTLGNSSGSSSLRGKVTIEGSGLAAPSLQLRLWPAAGRFISEGKGITGSAVVQQDGTFEIANPVGGEQRLLFSDLPIGAYVKSARMGQADLLADPLRITGPVTDTIELVVSTNAGTFDGLLQNAQRQPVPGAQAVLIPKQRDRVDLYRTAFSDRDGRFTIRGVTPGEYKVFSWEDIPPYLFFDSAFVTRFEQGGVAVRIAESSTARAEVTVLPPAGR
jgi:hypothetical protein